MINKNIIFIFLILLTFFIKTLPSNADELSIIEQVTTDVNIRINQGSLLTEITDDKSFEKEASRLIEFAFINLNSKNLLTEDWFDLTLYCIARKQKYYKLAISILKKEYEIEKYHKLRLWLKKRITLLETPNFYENDFNINQELSDLREKVFK